MGRKRPSLSSPKGKKDVRRGSLTVISRGEGGTTPGFTQGDPLTNFGEAKVNGIKKSG